MFNYAVPTLNRERFELVPLMKSDWEAYLDGSLRAYKGLTTSVSGDSRSEAGIVVKSGENRLVKSRPACVVHKLANCISTLS